MLAIINERGKSYLTTSIKKYRMKNGAYAVPHADLSTEDFSQLPTGTRVSVDHRGHARTHREIIVLNEVKVLSNSNVLVEGDHNRCSCCWEHALDYRKYVVLVAITLDQIPSKTSSFKFNGIVVDSKDNPHHMFSLEVVNGLYTDIYQQVLDIVMPELQPVLDLRDAFDIQCKQQFGI